MDYLRASIYMNLYCISIFHNTSSSSEVKFNLRFKKFSFLLYHGNIKLRSLIDLVHYSESILFLYDFYFITCTI